jgi:uncharacterized protein YndB with AHSA1/START domain
MTNEPDRLERSVELDLDVDELWRLVSEPEELATWFAPEAQLEVVPGGAGRFVDDDGVARRAVVDAVEIGERLRFRWWSEDGGEASVVTMAIAATPTGSRLTVVEQRLDTTLFARAAADALAWRLDLLLLRVTATAAALV